jgi:hypothetical protein
MPDFRNMKLGRKAVKTDSRTPRLARYFTSALPAPPPSQDWSKGITAWGMLMNDTLGDCTIAGVGHAVQVFSANAGTEASVTDAEALQYYEQWDGYDPGDPSTDQGGVELDVLTNWKNQGFAGHELSAFAAVTPISTVHVRQAIALCGGVYIGVELPISAQGQEVWDLVGGPDGAAGSWGGHCVFVCGYDAIGVTCITWGALLKMTWAFWNAYVDECFALISPCFIAENGEAPNGFNLAQLLQDVAQIN